MSELGSQASVGIESVEWLDEHGVRLQVRVTGRWRRRRGWVGSETRGATTLVIEAGGRRHRFPAMPEPPSLAGVAPGTWRLSFSVPSELAPGDGGRAWLAIGDVTVPLPIPDSVPSSTDGDPSLAAEPPARPPAPAPADASSAAAFAGRDAGPASLEIERAWRRADDAERVASGLAVRVEELERALADERRERAQAAAALAERDRRRRSAEQRAHAEEAMRRDLVRQLAAGAEEAARARQAMGDLAAAEAQIRELEQRLHTTRRAGDEAARAVAAAQAARERAERALAGAPAASADPAPVGGLAAPERERLALEAALRARRRAAGVRVPAEPSAGGLAPPAAAVGLAESDAVRALRRELDARVAAEAGLRARVVQAETRLAARVLLEQRTTAALRELRSELGQLRAALGRRRERSRAAYEAISELRGALARLAPGPAAVELDAGSPAGDESAPPGPVVTPERLSDALTRLRESREPAPAETTASEPAAGSPASPEGGPVGLAAGGPGTPARASPDAGARRPTLEPTVRRLAGYDPGQAGRLLVDLLGAQRAAYPHPIAYDVVLGPGHGCVQVTLGRDTASVEATGVARAREQVDVQLVGDPARFARRLLAGRLRRLVPLGLARVRGRRDGLAAPRALLALPLDLAGLHAAGMRAEPESLLALVAGMIDPTWTRGERFVVGHVDERGAAVHLQIRDGRAPRVTRGAPAGRVATVLRGSADGLCESLAAPPGTSPAVPCSGDRGPLELLREWVNRAQSE
jgi:hypothetical protein